MGAASLWAGARQFRYLPRQLCRAMRLGPPVVGQDRATRGAGRETMLDLTNDGIPTTRGSCGNDAMASGAVGLFARRSFQIESLMAISIGTFLVSAGPASAFSFDQAIERCRQTVGRPIVKACLGGRRAESGGNLNACRTKASPRVRACVQRAMIAAYGWPKVEEAIEHCRQTIGRPIVRACMADGGNADLEECRARAAPQVRSCVRRTISQ
jgi:hypothetical protein